MFSHKGYSSIPLVFILILSYLLFTACTKKGQNEAPNLPKPVWTNFRIDADVYAIAFEDRFIWVGTDKGLFKYDKLTDKVIEKYDSSSGVISNTITTIKIAEDGNKWIGTHGGGLLRFDGKKWKLFTVPNLADPYVYDIVWDNDGSIWVANWKGVSIYDGKGWRSYSVEDGLPDEWVYAIAIDNDGIKWFGTEAGVSSFDGKKWKNYNHDNGLGATESEIGDYEKIETRSRYHTEESGKSVKGYNPNFVLSIAIDSNNNKWFGTWGAGISRFDGNRWKNYTVKDGLAGNFISDITIDKDGKVWAATDGGVSVLDGDKWYSFNGKDGLIGENLFTVAIDREGYKWFGAIGGISRLDGFSPAP